MSLGRSVADLNRGLAEEHDAWAEHADRAHPAGEAGQQDRCVLAPRHAVALAEDPPPERGADDVRERRLSRSRSPRSFLLAGGHSGRIMWA